MSTPSDGLEEFCREAWSRLVPVLGLYCGNTHLAEELAQEALIRAVGRWNYVRSLDQPHAWLLRISINLANSQFRRRRAERRALERMGGTDTAVIDDKAAALAVRQAVASLPPRERAVVLLGYFEGYTAPEIAAVLKLKPGHVRTIMHRALRTLQKSFEFSDDPEDLHAPVPPQRTA